jgi:hypothetical protein
MRKFFYFIKPFIPRRFQIFLRRRLIQINKKRYENIWPIYPGSETKPKKWIGWPNGKKFAFVLTHDVEHKRGYERVLKLMQIEKELGFVSSFNFVPERDYRVDKNLLQTIEKTGFEYGVHGLYHDGKLFQSKKIFDEHAKKINHYIKDWGAVGFRAPSMHHNLDWIGELDIFYDLSTFDTDPFEPQADGVNTIFPFWVKAGKNGKGYVELPYTLVQDFTCFILLKEKTTEIWNNKLEWIVKNGGMALLNVHPDYINFDNNNNKLEEFPIKYYKDFLGFVKLNYANQYWNALPRDVANYSKTFLQ